MGDNSKIEWTDATWNPIVGCSIVSPGCTNCYAMSMARRIELMQSTSHYSGTTQLVNGKAVWTGKMVLAPEHILTQPLRWRKPRMIFVNSMSDLFHESVPDAWIDRVFAVMALTPWHTFQVLTKRPARMREYFATWPMDGKPDRITDQAYWTAFGRRGYKGSAGVIARPLPNVLLGVSVEDQRRADDRRKDLSAIAASGWRTFVSYEPALGLVDWTGWEFLSWLISGGESGPRARPSHPDWHRAGRNFCSVHSIPYLFKQWGEWQPVQQIMSDGSVNLLRKGERAGEYHEWSDSAGWSVRIGKHAAGRLLDGIEHNGMPAALAEAA